MFIMFLLQLQFFLPTALEFVMLLYRISSVEKVIFIPDFIKLLFTADEYIPFGYDREVGVLPVISFKSSLFF